MTNIRKLAIQIYEMENRDKIMNALPMILEMFYPKTTSVHVEEVKQEGGADNDER